MKVRMLTLSCGPDGNFPPGSIRELPAKQAKALIAGEFAVGVHEDQPAVERATAEAEPATETAAAE